MSPTTTVTFTASVVVPILLTSANCKAATGLHWRLLRQHAERLGVPVYAIDRKRAVPAEKFMAALARAALVVPTSAIANIEELSDAEQVNAMRRQLGLRLKDVQR
jgi:hypothetical protein